MSEPYWLPTSTATRVHTKIPKLLLVCVIMLQHATTLQLSNIHCWQQLLHGYICCLAVIATIYRFFCGNWEIAHGGGYFGYWEWGVSSNMILNLMTSLWCKYLVLVMAVVSWHQNRVHCITDDYLHRLPMMLGSVTMSRDTGRCIATWATMSGEMPMVGPAFGTCTHSIWDTHTLWQVACWQQCSQWWHASVYTVM